MQICQLQLEFLRNGSMVGLVHVVLAITLVSFTKTLSGDIHVNLVKAKSEYRHSSVVNKLDTRHFLIFYDTITYKFRLTQKKLYKKTNAIFSIYGRNGINP